MELRNAVTLIQPHAVQKELGGALEQPVAYNQVVPACRAMLIQP